MDRSELYVNSLRPRDAFMIQIMACRLDGTKPLSELMLPYCQLYAKEIYFTEGLYEIEKFPSKKMHFNLNTHISNPKHFNVSFCQNTFLNNLEVLIQSFPQYCQTRDRTIISCFANLLEAGAHTFWVLTQQSGFNAYFAIHLRVPSQAIHVYNLTWNPMVLHRV